MLRAYVMNFLGSWVEKVALIEFAYSNNYHRSIEMSLYESLIWQKVSIANSLAGGQRKIILGLEEVDKLLEDIETVEKRL